MTAGDSFGPPGVAEGSPLMNSYTHHSPTPTTPGRYLLGVDEAGRGPVLGPLVYGIAYCPIEYKPKLETMGFADSKTLASSTREALLNKLSSEPSDLGWSVRVISPQAISSGMLKLPPTNLNTQSENATVLLIREVLSAGIDIAEMYVDALGPSAKYQSYLSELFPGIEITVEPKADATYPIVSAASIAAKVTRDAWIENWVYEEAPRSFSHIPPKWVTQERGSGYPSGSGFGRCYRAIDNDIAPRPKDEGMAYLYHGQDVWLPSIARFSWATVKLKLDKDAHPVTWVDEDQKSLAKAFSSVNPKEKGRCALAKEVGLKSIADL
ncbi:ribonuclease H2 subunit A [Cantharellus anzutake]|uniref:ribonuclease H2 subunit A n=1 Tax=Cantharellus anzutake TaxID=1750568 RepID=UPI001906707F|nr:ribonuclease H2 subunit A [Cantharellus anzutake]KAF8326619.1 ribonuclease H2 subunit A [Cantharellus anzutake]